MLPPLPQVLRGEMGHIAIRRLTLVLTFMLVGLFAFTFRLSTRTAKAQGNQPLSRVQAATPHERFATFLNGDGFKPQLILQNLTATANVTVIPRLILGDAEFALDPVAMAPHSSATVDLAATLSAHGRQDKRGTVAVEYTLNGYGGITAEVVSANEDRSLYLLSYAQSPEEYWSGTAYDAVLWAPDEGTQGFVAITNTSSTEERVVHATYLVNDDSKELPPIQIAPRQTYWLNIDNLVARSRENGTGIHLEYDEYPGDVIVEGTLFNKRTGFTKYIHFMDKSLLYPTGTLRSHFVLLGQQPPEEGYPAEVSFRSVAVVRNVDSAPVGVAPKIKYLLNGSVQSIPLPAFSLNPNESRIIDLSQEQKDGALPADLHQATLELVPDSGKISIVGELFNYDGNKGGYVVGPSFTSYPSRGTGSIWRTDGTFETTLMVQNTASEDDEVTLKLYPDSANPAETPYTKTFPIAPGGLLKINIKELQRDAIPDKDGHLLAATSGILSISGGHGSASKLAYDKVIHSADEANYVGLPPNPCDYVLGVSVDVFGSQNPYTLVLQLDWSQGETTYESAWSASSSNTNLAQIGCCTAFGGFSTQTATLTPMDGQSHSVSISHSVITAESCDACSADNFFPAPAQVTVPPKLTVTGISPGRGLIGATTSSVTISGTGLSGATVTAPTGITPTVKSTTSTSLVVDLAVAANATAGNNTLTVHSSGSPPQTATTTFFVQVPTSLSIVAGQEVTYKGNNMIECNGTNDGRRWGYSRCGTFTLQDQAGAAIVTGSLTASEMVTTISSNPPGLRTNTGGGTLVNGTFQDFWSFVAVAPPPPQPGAFAKVRQNITITNAGANLTYSNIRINCLDFEYNDVTVTDITQTGSCQ